MSPTGTEGEVIAVEIDPGVCAIELSYNEPDGGGPGLLDGGDGNTDAEGPPE